MLLQNSAHTTYKNKGGTVKTNWKEVAGEFMPPTLSIAFMDLPYDPYRRLLALYCLHLG